MADFLDANDLLEAFHMRDERAFAVIFEKFYPRLVVYSYRITGNEAQAEDIASDVLLKLFSRPQAYKTTGHYEKFLYTAARNASINYLKSIKKSLPGGAIPSIAFYPEEMDLLNYELDSALLEKLYAAIDRLPNKSKQVIEYIYIQKLSYQRVAELMQTTVKNIENIRAYALKKLRSDMA